MPTLSTVNGYLERLAKDPNAYAPDVKKQIDWRIGITGQSLRKAYPAGVKIAFGTDAGVSKHGRNADEFELMVKYGMPPVEALKAATVNAADLLGLSSEVGTIEPGKCADIIAVTGDPLADVTVLKKVDFVMARGEVVKAPVTKANPCTTSPTRATRTILINVNGELKPRAEAVVSVFDSRLHARRRGVGGAARPRGPDRLPRPPSRPPVRRRQGDRDGHRADARGADASGSTTRSTPTA